MCFISNILQLLFVTRIFNNAFLSLSKQKRFGENNADCLVRKNVELNSKKVLTKLMR